MLLLLRVKKPRHASETYIGACTETCQVYNPSRTGLKPQHATEPAYIDARNTPHPMPTLTEHAIPALPDHVTLRYDEARERWVLLAPERMFVPDETAVAVLQKLDGERSLGAVADVLAEEYDAPSEVILDDIRPMLQVLVDQRLLHLSESARPSPADRSDDDS